MLFPTFTHDQVLIKMLQKLRLPDGNVYIAIFLDLVQKHIYHKTNSAHFR